VDLGVARRKYICYRCSGVQHVSSPTGTAAWGKSLQLRLRAQIRDNPHLCTSATKRPAEKGGGWLLSGCFSLLSRSYGVNTTDAQGMYVPMRYIRTTYVGTCTKLQAYYLRLWSPVDLTAQSAQGGSRQCRSVNQLPARLGCGRQMDVRAAISRSPLSATGQICGRDAKVPPAPPCCGIFASASTTVQCLNPRAQGRAESVPHCEDDGSLGVGTRSGLTACGLSSIR